MNQSSAWRSWLFRHETILLLVIIVEVLFFNSAGRNFGTSANIANIVRQSVEIGLLALALTPIILTGGIDLSVGSLPACAPCFSACCGKKPASPRGSPPLEPWPRARSAAG